MLTGNVHYISIFVVIIEKHRSVTHFYGLEQLGTDHGAEAQFNKLVQRFTKDRVWPSIKRTLVAVIV